MLDDVTVRISVTDSGPGISEENQGHIFEKFRQLDGSITRNTSGTGLGLAISKELSDLLAGTLTVESKLVKEIEIRTLRMVLTCKNNDMDAKTILDRLSLI